MTDLLSALTLSGRFTNSDIIEIPLIQMNRMMRLGWEKTAFREAIISEKTLGSQDPTLYT
jgi:hypothetical protein